jgi:hypothetical protein
MTRANVSIETWGNETSLNSYVDRQHVILVGILHRDLAELDNHNIGQHDKINTQTSPEELRALSLSERAHCAYQAFSRVATVRQKTENRPTGREGLKEDLAASL